MAIKHCNDCSCEILAGRRFCDSCRDKRRLETFRRRRRGGSVAAGPVTVRPDASQAPLDAGTVPQAPQEAQQPVASPDGSGRTPWTGRPPGVCGHCGCRNFCGASVCRMCGWRLRR